MPTTRVARLPISAWRTSTGARIDSANGARLEPRFAPSAKVRARRTSITPAPASDMTKRIMATLEWTSQASIAAMITASTGSLASCWKTWIRTVFSRSGPASSTTSLSERIIRARPMPTRPTLRVTFERPSMKMTTPPSISTGMSALISKDRAWTTRVVPTLVPRSTASAAATDSMPRSTKDMTSKDDPVELCSAVATPAPTRQAARRFEVAVAMIWRSRSPKARMIPVFTRRVDQSSMATPASVSSSMCWLAMQRPRARAQSCAIT